MDYYKIGQAIRRYRKARGMSQEQLAESTGISVTHMSHIETGNTKLSLPVLVEISKALEVQTDQILFEHPTRSDVTLGELQALADGCSAKELQIIVDIVKAAKASLDKHLPR